jgi:hypothetical protein
MSSHKNNTVLVGMEVEVNHHSCAVPAKTAKALAEDTEVLRIRNMLLSSIRDREVAITALELGSPLPEPYATPEKATRPLEAEVLAFAHDNTRALERSTILALSRSKTPGIAVPEAWTRSVDGSAGAEFKFKRPVSVPLKGGNVDKEIDALLLHFETWGFKSFTSAGTHFHLGVEDWARRKFPRDPHRQTAAITLLAATIFSYEKVMFSLVPARRRSNDYCPRIIPGNVSLENPPDNYGVGSMSVTESYSGALGTADSPEHLFPLATPKTPNVVANWLLYVPCGVSSNSNIAYQVHSRRLHSHGLVAPFTKAVSQAHLSLSRLNQVARRSNYPSYFSGSYCWMMMSRHLPTFEFRIFPGTNNRGLLKGYARLVLGLLRAVDEALSRKPSILDFSLACETHPLFLAKEHTLEHLKQTVDHDPLLVKWLDYVAKDTDTDFDPFTDHATNSNDSATTTSTAPECVLA